MIVFCKLEVILIVYTLLLRAYPVIECEVFLGTYSSAVNAMNAIRIAVSRGAADCDIVFTDETLRYNDRQKLRENRKDHYLIVRSELEG